MYDWNHTVDTTDPSYYRWTQWLFLQLYKAGLAEKKEAPVNWCPSCNTVLANEQVIAGACERCGTPVEQRNLSQWFFRITKYAQRLLDNLEWIDWSDTTKKAQENWIGAASEGAELALPRLRRAALAEAHAPSRARGRRVRSEAADPRLHDAAGHDLRRHLHGARARAPARGADHDGRARGGGGVPRARRATDLVTRKKTDKEKTGVFTGAYAVNPATGEEIPVWIADYVLMEYGTGAIMAVPGHDERDFEFATQFGLPIVRVIAGEGDAATTPLEEAYVGEGVLVNSGEFDGMDWRGGEAVRSPSGSPSRGVGEARVNYRLHDWCISRQRYWGPPIPIIYCDACGTVPVPEDQLPVVLPHVENYKPDERASARSPVSRSGTACRARSAAAGRAARRT
jgi:leucyl-tRNA synthetase